MHGIVAGNSGAGDVIEKGQLAGAALLLGKQAGVLHRDGNLPGRGCQYVKVALLEDEFPLGMHCDHDSGNFLAHENRDGDEAFRGAPRNVVDSQILPRGLQIGADEQRFAGTNHVFAESISRFPGALGQDAIISDLEFEAQIFSLLERDVEMAGIENLSQFDLDGAQDLVLVEARTDRLPDLGQKFVLFGATMSIVADHVVFEGQAQLQGQTHHEPGAGGTERPPFCVGK